MELAADGLTSKSQPSWRPAAEPLRARQTSFDGSVDGSVRFGLQSRRVAAALITEALPFKASGGTRAPPPPLLHRYTRRKKLRNQALRDGAPKRLDRWPWLDEDYGAMSIAVLRQMFEQMVEKKDSAAIDRFYDPSFVMSSNGITQDFDAFAASHRTIYATPICYSVDYDEQAWVETTDWVAGRV